MIVDSKIFSDSIFYIALMACNLLFFGCNENRERTTSYDLYNMKPVSVKNIEFEELQLDTLRLDRIESSYVGFLSVSNDSIRFIDDRFGWMFVFDKEGNFHQRHLGQGRGPNELPMAGVQFYSPTPKGGHFFLGSSYDYYVFDQNYERIQQGLIRWQRDVPLEELQKNPDPEQHRSYDLAYEVGDIKISTSDVYLPLVSGSPVFSAFNFTTDVYAEEGRVLAKMDIESGNVKNIIGRLPPVFSENEQKRIFSFFKFEIMNNQIAISFMPDSLIYLFDLDFENIQGAFGFSGKQMDLNYQSVLSNASNNELRRQWVQELTNRGYYTSLTYVRERDLLFRGYSRGGESSTDGLQIYRGNTLIADVEVPRIVGQSSNPIATQLFKVIGYIEPWFYSNAVIDEMAEDIIIFRFKINS